MVCTPMCAATLATLAAANAAGQSCACPRGEGGGRSHASAAVRPKRVSGPTERSCERRRGARAPRRAPGWGLCKISPSFRAGALR